MTVTWHGEQLARVSHHSSASAKQLASKTALEKLRKEGEDYVKRICTCRDELKEHLAAARQWKKDLEAELKAAGKLQRVDDVDQSIDPYLNPMPEIRSKSKVAVPDEAIEEDMERPKEKVMEAIEEHLEQVMTRTYGYNPDKPEPPEYSVRQDTDLQDDEPVVSASEALETLEHKVSAPVNNNRTGISPDVEGISMKDGTALHVDSLPELQSPDAHVSRASSALLNAGVQSKQRAKAALLIDFSDDEDGGDELIITRGGEFCGSLSRSLRANSFLAV